MSFIFHDGDNGRQNHDDHDQTHLHFDLNFSPSDSQGGTNNGSENNPSLAQYYPQPAQYYSQPVQSYAPPVYPPPAPQPQGKVSVPQPPQNPTIPPYSRAQRPQPPTQNSEDRFCNGCLAGLCCCWLFNWCYSPW